MSINIKFSPRTISVEGAVTLINIIRLVRPGSSDWHLERLWVCIPIGTGSAHCSEPDRKWKWNCLRRNLCWWPTFLFCNWRLQPNTEGFVTGPWLRGWRENWYFLRSVTKIGWAITREKSRSARKQLPKSRKAPGYSDEPGLFGNQPGIPMQTHRVIRTNHQSLSTVISEEMGRPVFLHDFPWLERKNCGRCAPRRSDEEATSSNV